MRTISEQELKTILDKHGKWLRREEGGEKANLSCADLSYANLISADLMIFQFRRHWAYYTFDGALRIGCHIMPITEWALGFEEIGTKEGYTSEEIQMYGNFIRGCLEHFKAVEGK